MPGPYTFFLSAKRVRDLLFQKCPGLFFFLLLLLKGRLEVILAAAAAAAASLSYGSTMMLDLGTNTKYSL